MSDPTIRAVDRCYCPGCGEEAPPQTSRCPHCSWSDPRYRIPSVAMLLSVDLHAVPDLMFNGVSVAFLRRVASVAMTHGKTGI